MSLGIINSETIEPIAKGIKTSNWIFAIEPIIISQTPIDNKIALPEIPGIRKKENAINPINMNSMNDGSIDKKLILFKIIPNIAPARK